MSGEFLRTLRRRIWTVLSEPASPGEAGSVEPGVRVLSRRAQIATVVGAALLVIVGIGLVATARAVFAGGGRPESPPLAPGTFKPTPSQAASLKIETVATKSFVGEQVTDGAIAIDDQLSTPVYSPYSGRVTDLFAALGDVVKKGTPLMAVEAAEVVQAQSDLTAAKAQVDVAEANEKREHDLYDVKGAALKDWLQSQADLATASASLAAARNRLRILGKTSAEIDAVERNPYARTINPEAAVTAPIAGTVLQRQVGRGEYIQANGSTPVYVIGDLSKVWLIANVREADVAEVKVGDPVEVRVPAFPDRAFSAHIAYVAPVVDASTHRVPVRAEVDNPEGVLKPQMFASFNIVTGAARQSPGVPESAVIYEGDQARVWVANTDGSMALREIVPGRKTDGMIEVLSGVKIGERVVTSGAIFIDRAAQAD